MRRMPVIGRYPNLGMQDSERLGRVLPSFIQMRHVLNPICTSLAQLAWNKPTLQTHLKLRLPPTLQHLAEPIARRLLRAFPGSVAPDAPRIMDSLSVSKSAEQLLT